MRQGEDTQALRKKAARLIETGMYEAVWRQEKEAVRKREKLGQAMGLPDSVRLMGQEWPLEELEPLVYEGKNRELVLLDIHGGGFVEGTPGADDRLCAWYRERLGCTVISLDYRKAPLYPHPIPLCDIAAQIVWLAKERPFGLDPRHMVIMGHSAGGNLAAAYCLLAKREGLPQPCAQVLDYPYLDVEADCLTRPDLPEAIDPLYMEVFRQAYLSGKGEGAPEDSREGLCEGGGAGLTGRPDFLSDWPALHSPVLASRAEAEGLPPALLITCGRDSLGPEGCRYGELLRSGGVAVTHWHLAGACHAFIEHTFNEHSRFSVDEEQRRLAMETMPKLAEWIARVGFGR